MKGLNETCHNMRVSNLHFLSIKMLCDIFKQQELSLDFSPHGVNVVKFFRSLCCLERLLQIVEEINEMFCLLMEAEIKLNN